MGGARPDARAPHAAITPTAHATRGMRGCLPQADQPCWLGGIVSGAEREQAPVPVGLHPRAALPPHADLQNIRMDPGQSPEPQLQPGHWDTGES